MSYAHATHTSLPMLAVNILRPNRSHLVRISYPPHGRTLCSPLRPRKTWSPRGWRFGSSLQAQLTSPRRIASLSCTAGPPRLLSRTGQCNSGFPCLLSFYSHGHTVIFARRLVQDNVQHSPTRYISSRTITASEPFLGLSRGGSTNICHHAMFMPRRWCSPYTSSSSYREWTVRAIQSATIDDGR